MANFDRLLCTREFEKGGEIYSGRAAFELEKLNGIQLSIFVMSGPVFHNPDR
jgi:hypothetical protein